MLNLLDLVLLTIFFNFSGKNSKFRVQGGIFFLSIFKNEINYNEICALHYINSKKVGDI